MNTIIRDFSLFVEVIHSSMKYVFAVLLSCDSEMGGEEKRKSWQGEQSKGEHRV